MPAADQYDPILYTISSMTHLKIQQKDVYIVQSHHQVLEAWELAPHCNVLTLDYHTDTRKAFNTYAYWRTDSEVKAGKCKTPDKRKNDLVLEKIQGYKENRLSIEEINRNLRHDEHIDFAVRTGIAEKVFVLSRNRNESSANPRVFQVHDQEEYKEQPIIEYTLPEKKGDKRLCDDLLDSAMNEAEELEEGFFDRFILDIDCDFFNQEKNLHPATLNTFGQLVNRAELITIAKEPECVKICRNQGSTLTAESIKNRLLDLIELALAS